METLPAESAALGSAGPRPRVDRGMSALRSEDFFKILVTELQSQDPFEPSKTSDMVSQVSQIRSIELSSRLGDTLDALTRQQRTGGVAELLGRYVVAVTRLPDGSESRVEGVVSGVSFASDGSAVLELDNGQSVRAADVVRVTTLEQIEREQAQVGAPDAATPGVDGPDGAAGTAQPAVDKQEAASRPRDADEKPGWLAWDWKLRL